MSAKFFNIQKPEREQGFLGKRVGLNKASIYFEKALTSIHRSNYKSFSIINKTIM